MVLKNLRKSYRFLWDRPVEVYPIFPSYKTVMGDPENRFLQGRLANLSEEGLGLALEEHLLAGSILKFNFKLNEDRRVEIFGKIVWSKENFFGAKFLTLTGIPRRTIKSHLAAMLAGEIKGQQPVTQG